MGKSRHPAYPYYLYSVIAAGFAVIAFSLYLMLAHGSSWQWVILASLTVLTGSFTVKIPGVNSSVSVSDSFVFTNLILFGPAAGSVTAALDVLVGSLRFKSKSNKIEQTLFNTAGMAISAFVAGEVFFLLLGRGPLYEGPSLTLREILPPLGVLALLHYVINSGSVAIIVALEIRQKIYRIWRESFLWTSITYFTGASVAGLIALNANRITPSVLGVIVPILLVTYFTYKTYLDKVEDNLHHLRELNQLYLSTVEALAMAIDAKDQVTHGHVRRVQVYARGLARALGITSDRELRGIEAAALLHDIGKLAIPEYILNKPGELTATEFQKMMVHPGVGAGILGSIAFPYPVQDLVRHHHERWDGKGYPDGLKGEGISLGARLLAVADCYDALTCDRPYRSGYSREKAIEIIRSRSGEHYDPKVVETFERILDELVAEVAEIDVHELNVEGLKAIVARSRDFETKAAARSQDPVALEDISSTHKEVFALYELAQTLGTTLNLQETLIIVGSKIAKIVPFTTCVVYLYSSSKGRLSAEHVSGRNREAFRDYGMELGGRLSGWVAAHGQPAVNSDPVFDITPVREKLECALTNALVFPLTFDGKCLGTISLYSDGSRFKDDHARIMEVVSKQAATAIHNALKYEETKEDAFTDPLTSLPNSRYLYLYFEQEVQKAIRHKYSMTILGMDLDGFKAVNDAHGHHIGDRMLVEVAKLLKGSTRGCDCLVRYAGDEFVAVLSQTTAKEALPLVRRIQAAIGDLRLPVRPGKFARVGISIGIATYPDDADTLEALMEKADAAMYRDKESRSRIAGLSGG